MPSFALFVTAMVLVLPAICINQEMVCIKNSASSDSTSQCVYRGKVGEKGEKGDAGEVNKEITGKPKHFEH